MFSLVGSIAGPGFGEVILSAGDYAGNFSGSGGSELFDFDRNTVFPLSVARQFLAHNGEPILLFAGLYADNFYSNGIVDLADPPTFSITVPSGVSYMSNSGVFTNVGPASVVPEPASGALLLAGLGAACAFGRRGRLSASAA